MGHESMNIFQILLPAVVLHGTFDFVLFLMGVIGAAYEVRLYYMINLFGYYCCCGTNVNANDRALRDAMSNWESPWSNSRSFLFRILFTIYSTVLLLCVG